MEYAFLHGDPKAEYATAWRIGVEEARDAAKLPSCFRTLFLLFLATFSLQMIAALLREYVNPDGITYLCTVDCLLQGDLQAGLQDFGVNVFIYMLVLFKWLGWDPFHAGVWWNVIISSVAVLPLFGWVRRMFDIRIAIVASLLYAFHPIVLSVGSAIMRDPMFWLFFNFTIYASWRAVTETRLRWFLMAGCSLTLAIHTRSEAWFLVIPILLWALGRLRFAKGYRVWLCVGTLLLLTMVPGSIALMNVTVLKACPQWGIFRPLHARQLAELCVQAKEKVKEWRETESEPSQKVSPQKASEPSRVKKQGQSGSNTSRAAKPTPVPSKAKQTKKTEKVKESSEPPSYAMAGLRRAILRAVKSYSYLYGIYGLIGVCVWRGHRRFALHAMLLMAIPLFTLIWYKSCNSDVSPRYFLPVVFISLPVIAIGLLWVCQKMATVLVGRSVFEGELAKEAPSKIPLYGFVAVMVFTLVISCAGAVWGTSYSEQKECELGKWVLENFGPEQRIYCFNRKSRMAAWYANARDHYEIFYPVYGPNKKRLSNHWLDRFFRHKKFRVILCWENYRRPKDMASLFDVLKEKNYFGYEVVQTGVMEDVEPKVIVLVPKDEKQK